MKYSLLVSTLVFTIGNLIAQNNSHGEFVLSGKVNGQNTGYVHLYYINSNEKRIHDSCLLNNDGEFIFRGLISEPSRGFFHGNRKSQRTSDPNAIDIYLEPKNIQAIFEINKFKDGKITGSNTHAEYVALEEKHREVDSTKWKKFWNDYNNAKANKDSVEAVMLWEKNIAFYRADYRAVDYDFMQKNPGSYTSVAVLLNEDLPTDSVKMFYSNFLPFIQQSRNGKIIAERIRSAEAIAIGNPAPDFTQADLKGNIISLSDFKGKYVLLEFWASWCIPCRQQNPFLKKLYDQYKDRNFIILGISKDNKDQKQAWIDAIKKDGITWPQLSDPEGNESIIARKYNVQPIPANFLIDPAGKIIATELYGDALQAKLKKLF
ncbi:MAG: resA 7 [Chitinophagaceae bacterium]|nr:resA 7 [Chitinophagaceae bacterium]